MITSAVTVGNGSIKHTYIYTRCLGQCTSASQRSRDRSRASTCFFTMRVTDESDSIKKIISRERWFRLGN